jgi:hypothetical protein
MEDLKGFTIQGDNVDFIKDIPGEFPYKPTITNDAGEEVPNTASPLFGKSYRRFAYNGKVFIAQTNDSFCSLYDNEELWSVRFTTDEAGNLSLVKGISIDRATKTATTKRKLNIIANAPMNLEPVNDDLMADITNSSIG